MYSPKELTDQSFVLMDKTAAALSSAEISMVKAETELLGLPYAQSLRAVLLMQEALAAIRLTDYSLEPTVMFRLDALIRQGGDAGNHELTHQLELDGYPRKEAVVGLKALRYRLTLEWLAEKMMPNSSFSPQLLLDIRRRCQYGRSGGIEAGFRQRCVAAVTDIDGGCLYQPPAPDDLPRHIQALCDFMNRRLLSPVAQSAVSHFYFESIKPFEGQLHSMELLLGQAMLVKRGLYRQLLAPISILPAIDTVRHLRCLLPYHLVSLSEGRDEFWALQHWMEHCARNLDVAVSTMEIFAKAIEALTHHWFERLGKVEKGSALEGLIYALPGQPIITVTQAMTITGRGFSAANDALARLEQSQVVRQSTPIGRNRSFAAWEALELYKQLGRKVLPA